MIIVLGATGHIGSAVADALLDRGEAVLAVTRSAEKAEGLRGKGAEVAVVDVGDADALRAAFRRGRRAFLLNPPAPPASDTDAEEHRTLASIVAALEGSGLEQVVALSTYGAQAGRAIGDLGTLHAFEAALSRQPIPATILRAAYLMSNWDALLPAAREGRLPTMLPPDMRLPMVAPPISGAPPPGCSSSRSRGAVPTSIPSRGRNALPRETPRPPSPRRSGAPSRWTSFLASPGSRPFATSASPRSPPAPMPA